MSFLYPYVLLALLLPVLLAVVTILARRRSQQVWQMLVSPAHRDELVTRSPFHRTVLPAILGLLALTFTILAAARPINGYTEAGATTNSRNILIALDISRSMETQDVKPSRLEQARSAAYELIKALPEDKIGLIIFSGEANTVVPLTYDHASLSETLQLIDRSWVAAGGTNFQQVLDHTMENFKRSAPDGTNALIILSDGEDTVRTSPEAAAEARERHLLVITVGIGTEAGGTIPDAYAENGLWRDASGRHVVSKLNVRLLRDFASATGGAFYHMNSGTNLSAFVRESVTRLERHEEAFSINKCPNDLFVWFAIIALVLLVSAILLSTEWRKRAHTALLLPVGLLLLSQPVQAAASRESAEAYAEGNALAEQQLHQAAQEAYSRALLDEDPTMQTAALHALGNLASSATFDKLRLIYDELASMPPLPDGSVPQPAPEQLQSIVDELRQTLVLYHDALKITPDFAPARTNISGINRLISELEKEIEHLNQEEPQQNAPSPENDSPQDNPPNDLPQDNPSPQDDNQPQDNAPQDEAPQQQDTPEPEDNGLRDEEKARQRAESLLRMHMDEEMASPIPPQNTAILPEKDY